MMSTNHNKIYFIFLWLCSVFYIVAGINHFLAVDTYLTIVPSWLPANKFLIYLSGAAEIILGVLLLFEKTRKWSAIFIILMLIVYLPLHIQMIIDAPFMLGNFLITKIIAWIRLPIQFALIAWAAMYIKNP